MYTQAPLRSHDVVPGDELGEAPRGGEEPVGVVAHGHEVALVVLAPPRAPLHLPPLHPGLRGGPGHHGVQCSRYPHECCRRLICEVVQSRRRPLLGPSPG